jgi:hypothetical protein
MGEYFRLEYPELVGAAASCDELFFYADDCLRDFQTATEFMKGMAPECSDHLNITTADAEVLFNQGGYQTEECGFASRDAMDSLLGGSRDNYASYNRAHASFVSDVQAVVECCVDTTLCAMSKDNADAGHTGEENEETTCTLSSIPSYYTGQYWSVINGSTPLAGYFASFFTLAALNNMTLGLSGAERTLEEIIGWYHDSSSTLGIADSSFTSPSFASTLASHLVASMHQAATGKNIDALAHGPGTSFVYMAGHDTNLVLLRTLLDLAWLADGWHANDPGPGGMLIFELFDKEDEGDEPTVAISFQIAEPKQIRGAERLTETSPPSRTTVALPGCGGLLRCPLSNFTMIVLDAIRPECVGMSELASWVDTHRRASPDQRTAWLLVLSAVALVLVTSLVVAPLALYLRPKEQKTGNSNLGAMRTGLLAPGDNI